MSYDLEFVDSNLTKVLSLSDKDPFWLDYDKSSIPVPDMEQTFTSPSNTDGEDYVDGRHKNITITITVVCKETSIANLDASIKALVAQVTKSNLLKFTPEDGDSLYYETFPMKALSSNRLLPKWRKKKIDKISFSLQAKPWAFTAKEILLPALNLLPNWDFETPGVGGEPVSGWTKWEENADAHVTQDATAGFHVYGTYGVTLTSKTTGKHARITTTDFITVDKAHHFNMIWHSLLTGAIYSRFTCGIEQYDVNGTPGTITSITSRDYAGWGLNSTVIHPTGSADSIKFDSDCAKVKIYFDVSGYTTYAQPENHSVDGVWFGDTEMISGHELVNPAGLVIKSTDLKGNIPSPVDIILSKLSGCEETVAIYIGGREAYSDDFVPELDAITGTTAYSNKASKGVMKSMPIPGESLCGGDSDHASFNHITGTPLSNSETFDGWTVSRGSCWMFADIGWPYQGIYNLRVLTPSMTPQSCTIETTDYVAFNRALDHRFSVFARVDNYAGSTRLKVEVNGYQASPGAPVTLVAVNTTTHRPAWTEYAYDIPANTFNNDITQIKVKITFTVKNVYRGIVDSIRLDKASLVQSVGPVSFEGQGLIETVKGKVKPFLHYALNGAQTDHTLTLQGKLKSGSTDLTDLALIQSGTVDLPATYIYQGDECWDMVSLPTAKYSDDAVTTALYQNLQVLFDSAMSAGVAYLDSLVILPLDNGYAVVLSDGNPYLVFDSRSANPSVMASIDGTVGIAAGISSGRIYNTFRVNPRDGSNIVILNIFADANNDQVGQFLADIRLEYFPRHLVVA